MQLHDQLFHYGVKGMKWGVRKPEDRLSRRVDKHLKKAEKFEKKAAASDPSKNKNQAKDVYNNVNAGIRMMQAPTATGVGLALLDGLKGSSSFKEMKFSTLAESERRKADALLERAKTTKMSSLNKKERLTPETAMAKVKAYAADPHNQKKAILTADKTERAIYWGRKALKAAIFVASVKLAYDGVRQYKNIGRGVLPKDTATKQIMEKALKEGVPYVIGPDGVLRKYKMPKW